MNIGDRIKKRRLELGYSVDDIAKCIGKNRATIYRYESSEIEDLPTSILEPLAKALHTTPAYLMGWESKPKLILLKNDYTNDCDSELNNEEIALLKHFKKSDIDTKMQILADLEIDILGYPVGETRYKKLTKSQRLIAENIDEEQIKLFRNYCKLTIEGKKKLLDYSNDLVSSGNYSNTVTIAEAARTNNNRKSLKEKQTTKEELEIFDIAPQSDEEL